MRILTLLIALTAPAWAGLVTISETIKNPDGTNFSGTVAIRLNNPGLAQPLYNSSGQSLTGFQRALTVTDGVFLITLEANDAITPAGTSYSAQFRSSNGAQWSETWTVPTSVGSIELNAIRSTTTPSPTVMISPQQISAGGATAGQGLVYSGTSWGPSTILLDPTTTAGDLIYRGASTLGRLPIGSAGQVLGVSAGLPAWLAVPACATCIVTSGSYADPSWLTSLAGSKVSGNISGNAATATALAGALTSGAILKGQGTGIPAASILSESAITSTYDSTARTAAAITESGLSRIVQTRPASESKRIVIAGSSVAAGTGATSYATSWAGLFQAAMEAKGYTVYNVSISGNSTAAIIARFYTDIAPLKPDFVIHATGMPNDSYSIDTYKANIHRLLKMTEGIGARPVVIGQYGNNSMTTDQVRDIKDLYVYLDQIGVPVWDFWSATTDPTTGAWLTGVTYDALHPNDTGHRAMYQAIPLTSFDIAVSDSSVRTTGASAWLLGADTSTVPLSATLDRTADSWTVGAWIRGAGFANTAYLSTLGYSATPRIRCNGGVWDASTLSGVITSSVSCVDLRWHLVAISHNKITETDTLWVDGAAAGSITVSGYTGAASGFSWFGRYDSVGLNATNTRIALPFAYRSPLGTEDMAAIYRGRLPRKSLDVLLPLDQSPLYRPRNASGTSIQPVIGSSLLSLATDWVIGGVPSVGLTGLSTAYAIPYVSAPQTLSEDPAALCWDSANNYLGVNTCSPGRYLEVAGDVKFGANTNWSSIRLGVAHISTAGGSTYSPAVEGGSDSSTATFLRFSTSGAEAARFTSLRNFLVNTTTDDGVNKVQVNGNVSATTFVGALTGNASTATALSTAASGTPASATATCTTGAVQFDASYIYVCHATNTWKRAPVVAW